jgi:hypothetical protein
MSTSRRATEVSGEPGTSCEPSAEQLTRLLVLLEPEGRDLRTRAVHALYGETIR